MIGEGGKDATKAFEDVNHTEEAKELMKEYLVGFCSDVSSSDTTCRNIVHSLLADGWS